jgi:predicted transcriptional regulator
MQRQPHQPVSFSLAQTLVRQLQREAERQRRPISWVVTDALASYLSSRPLKEEEACREVGA